MYCSLVGRPRNKVWWWNVKEALWKRKRLYKWLPMIIWICTLNYASSPQFNVLQVWWIPSAPDQPAHSDLMLRCHFVYIGKISAFIFHLYRTTSQTLHWGTVLFGYSYYVCCIVDRWMRVDGTWQRRPACLHNISLLCLVYLYHLGKLVDKFLLLPQ